MATLTVSATDDFSADLLSNIDTIEFTNAASATATFAALQFDNIAILDTVTLIGNGQTNAAVVNGGDVNASAWQFKSWTASNDSITLNGTSSADVITGSSMRDTISGSGGRDTLEGGGKADTISGGTGADKLAGGLGGDTITGEGGNDTIKFYDGEDTADPETVDGGAGTDVLLLQNVEEVISFVGAAITRVERLEYRQGADAYFLSDHVLGKNGFSEVVCGGGSDRFNVQGTDFDLSALVIDNYDLAGGDGIFLRGVDDGGNTITGTNYSQWIYGGAGDDRLTGGDQGDILVSQDGKDTLAGGEGDDQWLMFSASNLSSGDSFDGGGGFDQVNADQQATDTVFDFRGVLTGVEAINSSETGGGAALNTIILDSADFGAGGISLARISAETRFEIHGGDIDVSGVNFYNQNKSALEIDLIGGTANDSITGSSTDDRITGGAGGDTLTGGGGKDHFVYEDLADSTAGQGRDVIADFTQGSDVIEILPALGFDFLGTGGFTSSGNAEIRITTSGADTIVNIDGDGDGTAESKIVLAGSYVLAAADFILS